VVAVPLEGTAEHWSTRVETLYREHGAAMLGFAHARTSSADAEDVVADAFRKAAGVLKRNPAACIGRAWLLTVVRNAIIDRWRQEQRWKVRLTALHVRTTDTEYESPGDGRVWSAIDRLDPHHREVLLLRYVGGLSIQEIAHAIDKSVDASESLVRRARQRLAVAYEEER
jgi:RNA polymerase sigma-70 factor (ECF subfamily)